MRPVPTWLGLGDRLQGVLKQCQATNDERTTAESGQIVYNPLDYLQNQRSQQPMQPMDWDPASDCSMQAWPSHAVPGSAPCMRADGLHKNSSQILLNSVLLNSLATDQPPLLEAVRSMLNARTDPNTKEPETFMTPLICAVKVGSEPIVEELLRAGAVVNDADHVGVTPLIAAASAGKHQIVAQLLGHKADVTATKRSGEDALRIASQFGFSDVVDLLLQSQASPSTKDRYGVTAIMKAEQCGHTRIVNKLVAANATWQSAKVQPAPLTKMQPKSPKEVSTPRGPSWADISEDFSETTATDFIAETSFEANYSTSTGSEIEVQYPLRRSTSPPQLNMTDLPGPTPIRPPGKMGRSPRFPAGPIAGLTGKCSVRNGRTRQRHRLQNQ